MYLKLIHGEKPLTWQSERCLSRRSDFHPKTPIFMNMNIIQHHEPFDFETFFKQQKNVYIGVDYQDYENIFIDAKEVHSFIGTSDSENRVEAAIRDALNDSEVIIDKAKSVLIQFLHSSGSKRSLHLDEMSSINEMMARFPEDCNIVWGLSDDDTLGNAVKVMLIVAIKD